MANKNEEKKQQNSKKTATNKKVDSKTTKNEVVKNSKPKENIKQNNKTTENNKKEIAKKEGTKQIKKQVSKEETKQVSKKEVMEEKETVKKVKNKEQEIIKEEKTKNNEQEIKVEENKVLAVFEKIIVLVAVALVFSLIGFFIGKNNVKKYNMDSAELQIFVEQYNKIIEEYYEEVDKNELIKGAIEGMLSKLDGYSEVIDDSSNSFSITLEGSYEGLGVEVINDSYGNILVYSVYENTPAAKAGLKVNDIITKINDTDLKNVSTTDFVNQVSQTENIKLTVTRGTKELTFELKKEFIILPSVSSKMLNNKIGYIKVDLFANNTTEQFKKALENLEKEGMKSLIIDLRDNTGGHLNTVKDMLSLMLDSSNVIYQTESRTELVKYYSNGSETKKYKIVILQNELTASASEIMASTLKEQIGAYIIGKSSYGKGTVQQLETVDGIGQYKFTTKKWLTPNGVWLNGTGLQPDLDVTQTEDYYKNPTDKNDAQLQAAIKYLNK